MLQIAICDDNKKELSALSVLTRKYLTMNKISGQLFEFTHPDARLTACESRRFHLYILDILLPMVDGIALDKEIRQRDNEAQIIYATTEPSFALQSFATNPINFLVKPVDQQVFLDTLELALSKIRTEGATLTVKTKDGVHTLALWRRNPVRFVGWSEFFKSAGAAFNP